MRFLRCSLAIVATCVTAFAMTAVPASAAITLVNGGFETGTTAGWTGTGSATTNYAGYTAQSGTYFGIVESSGCSDQRLTQTFTATAGDTLSGWAFFKTNDYLPYDDNGDVKVVVTATGSQAVVFSSSVSQVGNYGGTPWRGFSHTIPSTGSYSLQVRVDNVGDCGVESAVGLDMVEAPPDTDGDGVLNAADNCPADANPGQADNDADGQGDVCDADDDNDSVSDSADNCDIVANTDQADNDADGKGDVCDADDDNDAVSDEQDNCQYNPNLNQQDDDNDGKGDACDGLFDSTAGKATGGGWMIRGSEKVHFSASAKSAADGLDGTCTVTAGKTKIKCQTVDGFYQSATDDRVVIVGTATEAGAATRYRIVLEDRGEPGTADRFTMSTDSGFSVDGVIGAGNIQVHRG